MRSSRFTLLVVAINHILMIRLWRKKQPTHRWPRNCEWALYGTYEKHSFLQFIKYKRGSFKLWCLRAKTAHEANQLNSVQINMKTDLEIDPGAILKAQLLFLAPARLKNIFERVFFSQHLAWRRHNEKSLSRRKTTPTQRQMPIPRGCKVRQRLRDD